MFGMMPDFAETGKILVTFTESVIKLLTEIRDDTKAVRALLESKENAR